MTSISKQKAKSRKRWAHRRGYLAEKWAELYLMLLGYRIVERRFKKPVGEIDLIVSKGKVLAAVEVKYRPSVEKALHSIGSIQQRRIRNAMKSYLAYQRKYESYDIRFDVIVITSFLSKPMHIKSAWE